MWLAQVIVDAMREELLTPKCELFEERVYRLSGSAAASREQANPLILVHYFKAKKLVVDKVVVTTITPATIFKWERSPSGKPDSVELKSILCAVHVRRSDVAGPGSWRDTAFSLSPSEVGAVNARAAEARRDLEP